MPEVSRFAGGLVALDCSVRAHALARIKQLFVSKPNSHTVSSYPSLVPPARCVIQNRN